MIKTKIFSKYIIPAMIMLIAVLLSACRNRTAPSEPEISARTPVTLQNPSFTSISDSIDLPAITTYLKRNVIKSSVAGVIESVSLVQGESISKGKEVFTLRTKEASVLRNNQPADTSLGIRGLIKVFNPQDGVVSSVSHQAGDFVQEGDELAVVADNKSLVFVLQVPYEMTTLIKINGSCSLLLPDNTRMKGRITGRFPEMDKQNQTIGFVVNAGNISKLPENLIASGLIVKNEKKNVQVLQKQALLGNETQTSFWVMKLIDDSTAVKVMVKKGIENEQIVEIEDPVFLKTDRILISGNYGLPDTASVIVVK
jgi:multidrug efflux pump subunit AcrA (membrane-fusion protein)